MRNIVKHKLRKDDSSIGIRCSVLGEFRKCVFLAYGATPTNRNIENKRPDCSDNTIFFGLFISLKFM